MSSPVRAVAIAAVAWLAVVATGTPAGAAEAEVSIPFQERTLRGSLEVPPGRRLADGVILLVHGNRGHKDMETMAALRRLLNERGFATLAVTLSLGQDGRRGVLPCDTVHRHTHAGALAEIGAWVDWLKAEKGARFLTLLGHSRGGNQVLRWALAHDDPAVERLVLLAPMTWDRKRDVPEGLAPRLAEARDRIAAGEGDAVLPDVPFLGCTAAEVTAAALVGYYGRDPRRDSPALLPEVGRRTLVLAAGGDTVVPDLADRLDELPDGPASPLEIRVIPGADHMFLDFFAIDAADAIELFLIR